MQSTLSKASPQNVSCSQAENHKFNFPWTLKHWPFDGTVAEHI